MKPSILTFTIILLLILFLPACQPSARILPSPSPTGSSGEITVAAAADLQFAFTDIAKLYEDKTGHKVILVFGSTGQLVQQIENGAPFDIMAAANITFIDRLVEKGLAHPDSVAIYARGRIVLAVNNTFAQPVTELEDLLSDQIKRVAIANPEHAPYGLAAKQALQTDGVWEKIQPKLVYGENVRHALQFIQTGDMEAGIIALSLADVPEISWTLIDEELHEPLDQALAITTYSKNPALAADFIAFINGEAGRPIMRSYGFLLPDEIHLLMQE